MTGDDYFDHFNFIGVDTDHKEYISFRIDMAAPPTYERLQGLLCDLYMQRRASPQYLFVAEQDQIALTRDIQSNPALSQYRPLEMVVKEFGLRGLGGVVRSIGSYATGSLVNIVSLPDLDQGSVIVGFLR